MGFEPGPVKDNRVLVAKTPRPPWSVLITTVKYTTFSMQDLFGGYKRVVCHGMTVKTLQWNSFQLSTKLKLSASLLFKKLKLKYSTPFLTTKLKYLPKNILFD